MLLRGLDRTAGHGQHPDHDGGRCHPHLVWLRQVVGADLFWSRVFDEQLRQTHSFTEAFAKAVPLIQQREVEAGKADGFSNPQIRVGPQITPVLQALEQRLQALETNASNEIPVVAADTAEPALATVAATPPAATPTARP